MYWAAIFLSKIKSSRRRRRQRHTIDLKTVSEIDLHWANLAQKIRRQHGGKNCAAELGRFSHQSAAEPLR